MLPISYKIRTINKFKIGLWIFFGILIITGGVWYTVLLGGEGNQLTVSMLNIGQGDAIYIKAPNGVEMVVDGGPDQKLLSELGTMMPFFDKSIDMIVVTNPDKDHYAGFIDALDRYKIKTLVEPGTDSSTPTYYAFKEKIKEKGVKETIVRKGTKIILDENKNIYLEILFPDRDVSGMSTNDGSLVSKLVYGNTCIMLQGDSPSEIEKYLLSVEKPENLKCQILKAGHHGSRTSTSKEYVKSVNPEFVLISDGQNNRYGHPHKEVLETLKNIGVKVLRTDLDGRITFVSDGISWKRK